MTMAPTTAAGMTPRPSTPHATPAPSVMVPDAAGPQRMADTPSSAPPVTSTPATPQPPAPQGWLPPVEHNATPYARLRGALSGGAVGLTLGAAAPLLLPLFPLLNPAGPFVLIYPPIWPALALYECFAVPTAALVEIPAASGGALAGALFGACYPTRAGDEFADMRHMLGQVHAAGQRQLLARSDRQLRQS